MAGSLSAAIKPSVIQKMLDSEKYITQIQTALPAGLDAKRMARILMTEIRKNPKLAECDPMSVFGSFMVCNQLGLQIGAHLGHAYLIPYKREAQLIIGYRGMIDLARRSGQVVSTQARVVKENDMFDFELGLNETLQHRMPLDHREPRGETIYVYAFAHLVKGGHQFEVLRIEDIQKAKNASKDKRENSIWNLHYDEMAKKTAIRRLFKYLPLSTEIERAVVLDEQAESGVPQGNRDAIDLDISDFSEENKAIESEVPEPESENKAVNGGPRTEENYVKRILACKDLPSLNLVGNDIQTFIKGEREKEAIQKYFVAKQRELVGTKS